MSGIVRAYDSRKRYKCRGKTIISLLSSIAFALQWVARENLKAMLFTCKVNAFRAQLH